MAENTCVCGQHTGRICPLHPNKPVELRTMHGPPLPPDAEVPWIDPRDEAACFADWDARVAERGADIASKAGADAVFEETTAEAIVNDQQRPETRGAFDRVFKMTGPELGRAAVEGARQTRGLGRGPGGPLDP